MQALCHYVRVIHALLPICEDIRREVEDPLGKKQKLANVVLHPLRDAVRKASCQVTKFSESGSSKNVAMYISDNAIEKLTTHGIQLWPRRWPTGFILEHVIPVSVLLDNIITRTRKGELKSKTALVNFFLKYSHLASITDGDDNKLKQFNDSMPERFSNLEECSRQDIFARYLKCNISLQKRDS